MHRCWLIVKWTPRNKFHWNLNQLHNIFIWECEYETIVYKMATILSYSDDALRCSPAVLCRHIGARIQASLRHRWWHRVGKRTLARNRGSSELWRVPYSPGMDSHCCTLFVWQVGLHRDMFQSKDRLSRYNVGRQAVYLNNGNSYHNGKRHWDSPRDSKDYWVDVDKTSIRRWSSLKVVLQPIFLIWRSNSIFVSLFLLNIFHWNISGSKPLRKCITNDITIHFANLIWALKSEWYII